MLVAGHAATLGCCQLSPVGCPQGRRDQPCCVSVEHKCTLGQQPPSNSTRVLGFLKLPGQGDKQWSRKCLTPGWVGGALAQSGSCRATPEPLSTAGDIPGVCSMLSFEVPCWEQSQCGRGGVRGCRRQQEVEQHLPTSSSCSHVTILAVTLQVTQAPQGWVHTQPRKAGWT